MEKHPGILRAVWGSVRLPHFGLTLTKLCLKGEPQHSFEVQGLSSAHFSAPPNRPWLCSPSHPPGYQLAVLFPIKQNFSCYTSVGTFKSLKRSRVRLPWHPSRLNASHLSRIVSRRLHIWFPIFEATLQEEESPYFQTRSLRLKGSWWKWWRLSVAAFICLLPDCQCHLIMVIVDAICKRLCNFKSFSFKFNIQVSPSSPPRLLSTKSLPVRLGRLWWGPVGFFFFVFSGPGPFELRRTQHRERSGLWQTTICP